MEIKIDSKVDLLFNLVLIDKLYRQMIEPDLFGYFDCPNKDLTDIIFEMVGISCNDANISKYIKMLNKRGITWERAIEKFVSEGKF